MSASDIAASGMYAFTRKMAVKASNIANAKTIAFKAQEVEFKDNLYQTRFNAGTQVATSGTNLVPTPQQIGTGVQISSIYRDFSKGEPRSTESPYDLYIKGEGFFKVQYPDGTMVYTQAGNFTLDNQGQIVTAEGYPLGDGFFVPENTISITINRQGDIFAQVDGETTPQNVGQITLMTFSNPRGLEAIGENLYRDTPASGDPVEGQPGTTGFGQILQKNTEASNVNLMTEIVEMIDCQIVYQACAEAVRKDTQNKEVDVTLARSHS